MIEAAGIAIFLFGNKKDKKGKVIPSPGVEQEYQLARSYGIPCIAIGCTGGMSKQLAKEIVTDLTKKELDDEHGSIAVLRRDGMLDKLVALNKDKRDLREVLGEVLDIVDELRTC